MGYAKTDNFELLETIRWAPDDGYFLLDRHLERMRGSASVFGFRWPEAAIAKRLRKTVALFAGKPHRVRLLVSRDGGVDIAIYPLEAPMLKPRHVGLAPWPVRQADPMLYHKTSKRGLYDRALASRPDCDDVLLYNERGELTESCVANVVVERNGEKVTPRVSCGLLNGTYRASLLEAGEIREGEIKISELPVAGGLYLINSVRQWMPVMFVPDSSGGEG